jgi:hypothetical protein
MLVCLLRVDTWVGYFNTLGSMVVFVFHEWRLFVCYWMWGWRIKLLFKLISKLSMKGM